MVINYMVSELNCMLSIISPSRAMWSASTTGHPRSLSRLETVLLPVAIPPVKPTINMAPNKQQLATRTCSFGVYFAIINLNCLGSTGVNWGELRLPSLVTPLPQGFICCQVTVTCIIPWQFCVTEQHGVHNRRTYSCHYSFKQSSLYVTIYMQPFSRTSSTEQALYHSLAYSDRAVQNEMERYYWF